MDCFNLAVLTPVSFARCFRRSLRIMVLSAMTAHPVAWMCWAVGGFAAPMVEIREENPRVDLPAYIDVLEDPRARLSIDDVISEKYAHQFAPTPPTDLFFGYTRSVYWLRFTVENRLDHDKELILEVMPADIDYVEVHGFDPSHQKKLFYKRSGSAVGFDVRDYNHPFFYFDLTLPANDARVYYVRLESNKTINAKLKLSSPREHFFYSSMRDWWQGFFFGVILLLAFAHFWLARLFKYKGFTYCGLWLLSMILIQGSWNGYFTQFLSPSPQLLDRQLMFSVYLSAICGLLFTRTYLDTHRRTPIAHRILTGFLVLSLMGIPCAWLFEPWVNALLVAAIAVPVSLFMFGLSIYSFLDGYAPARYFLLARTTSTVMILAAIFSDHGLLPDAFVALYGLVAAFAMEGLVFLVVMAMQETKTTRAESAVTVRASAGASPAVPVGAFCHELRTPISGVLGMSELLLDTALSNQQRAQVESIHGSGKALLEVVNKMSDVASMESGELELHENAFELISLVESCVENARSLSEQRHIELIYQVAENLSEWVQGDRNRLQQIINNLVNYAIRHLESGEILLAVKQANPECVSFDVISGRNTFLQEWTATAEPSSGFQLSADQLNLAIAKRLISLMGGELLTRRRTDGGWSLSFQIPLRKLPRAPGQEDSDALLRGKCLMVVDDNDTCCKITQQQALRWGMEALSAASGKEAMALLRSRANLNKTVDLLLVDYDMPGMNGLEFLARLEQERATLKLDNVRTIIFTGVSKMPSSLQEQQSGAVRVLYKPLSGKNLKIALMEALQPTPV